MSIDDIGICLIYDVFYFRQESKGSLLYAWNFEYYSKETYFKGRFSMHPRSRRFTFPVLRVCRFAGCRDNQVQGRGNQDYSTRK